MTSWANLQVAKQRKGPLISSYFEVQGDDLFSNLVDFSYTFVSKQRSAEPMYVYDKKGMIQNLIKVSPIIHYVKEIPSSATNIHHDMTSIKQSIQNVNMNTLRKTIQSINIFNSEKELLVQNNLKSNVIGSSQFDVGIVLDVSGSALQAVKALKAFQARTYKKTIKIFVMTDNIHYLHDFVINGDKSWTFSSLMRNKLTTDPESMSLKMLSEVYLLQQIPHLFLNTQTSLGKYLYLTSKMMTSMDSSIQNLDGSVLSVF